MLRWYLERETETQIDEWELDSTGREAAIKEAMGIIDRLSDYDKKRTKSAWLEHKDWDEAEENLCMDFPTVTLM
jgi:hypothetical protein